MVDVDVKKSRDGLLRGDIAGAFFAAVLRQAAAAGLLSDEHFNVDGTMLEAWASLKSFQLKDTPPPDEPDRGNPTVSLKGQRRRNETHASRTRQFEAAGPNQRWVGNTSEFVMPASGKVYLAAVLDLFSRFAVGCPLSAINDRRLTIRHRTWR